MNGGSRRPSAQIGRKPAANIHHATRVAERLGYPLNQFVTINYTKTSCTADDATAVFRTLLASWFARWLRRHPENKQATAPTYVYAFEAAGGQIAVHWLVHIPSCLVHDFQRLLPEWVQATAGRIDGPGAIDHRRVYGIVGAKRYLLKGMDPHFARAWKIRPSPQGIVIGRRSGFSRNLGPTARRKASYQPQRRHQNAWMAEASQ